jgi:hypothetical protein
MAILIPYEAINSLFLAENSTEIFDDIVNVHAPFACESSLYFLNRLAVTRSKPTSEPELLRSVMARDRPVEHIRSRLQSFEILDQLSGSRRR